MSDSEVSEAASRVINAMHRASPERPDARDGEPAWYYELCSRIAVLVGDAEILFTSHSFVDSMKQDGTCWLFTSDVVIRGAYSNATSPGEVSVEVIGRKSLEGLAVNYVSDAFGSTGERWPEHVSVSLDYGSASVVLPLERYSTQKRALVDLLPSIAVDLNR